MLLMLSLKFGIIPIVVPVGVRDFDIDGELWVKLRLIPTEPWVGAVSWAFVSLPKIKFELSPFRLFNLMGMLQLLMPLAVACSLRVPFMSIFLNVLMFNKTQGRAVHELHQEQKVQDILKFTYLRMYISFMVMRS